MAIGKKIARKDDTESLARKLAAKIVGQTAYAKINQPSGGSTVDSQARAAIDSILNILIAAGIMKSS